MPDGPLALTWPPLVLAILLHVSVLAIVAWDLWASFSGWPQYTVSRLLSDWSMERPILPFAAGVVAGHLFWLQVLPRPK